MSHLKRGDPRPTPQIGAEAIPEPLLSLEGVTLTVGDRTLVNRLTFTLAEGEHMVLVGPNGSGKSTLLRAIAGLDRPASGTIRRPDEPPGMLFQDGALWPHMTVEQHLAFVDTRDDQAWREHLLRTFRLGELRDRRPEQLSGGEQIRLALARSMANRPRWVLLDEPLAHLDPSVRADVRATLPRELEQLGAAALIVTHHSDDVMLFGERLLCLDGAGGWWLGTTRFAIESPPNAALAAYSERGTVLEGRADESGRVDLGLGLALTGRTPGEAVRAFLDATAVRLSEDELRDRDAIFIAPDLRGGSWVRVDGQLLRSAESRGGLAPGDSVGVRIVGRVRELHEGPAG